MIITFLRRLFARFRAWRRRGQAWSHGRGMSATEVVEDVQKY